MVGPKDEREGEVAGMRYHVKNPPIGGWVYEELPEECEKHQQSARPYLDRQGGGRSTTSKHLPFDTVDPGGSKLALPVMGGRCPRGILADGKAVGTSTLDWGKIESFARDYVGAKAAAGRYNDVALLADPKPMWDMISQKEIFP